MGRATNGVLAEGRDERHPRERTPRQLALTSYGQEKFDRLVALKRRYDAKNLVRLNHNIPPD